MQIGGTKDCVLTTPALLWKPFLLQTNLLLLWGLLSPTSGPTPIRISSLADKSSTTPSPLKGECSVLGARYLQMNEQDVNTAAALVQFSWGAELGPSQNKSEGGGGGSLSSILL